MLFSSKKSLLSLRRNILSPGTLKNLYLPKSGISCSATDRTHIPDIDILIPIKYNFRHKINLDKVKNLCFTS